MITRDEWRAALDAVADEYDRSRPGYPDQLPTDVAILAGLPEGGRILEVGCGTGQLTTVFARRGYEIVAVEPGAALANLARRNCEEYPQVRVYETKLEDWISDGRQFDLVLAAQSFHLVDLARRFDLAANVLDPTGALAVIWNLRLPGDSPAHRSMQAAYADHAPTLKSDQFYQDTTFEDEIDLSGLFGSVFMRKYLWTQLYTAGEYVGLLESHATHHMLPEPSRTALFQAVKDGIEHAGGKISIDYLTRLYVARRREA